MYKRRSKKIPLYPRILDIVVDKNLDKIRKFYNFQNKIDDSIAHFTTNNLKYKKEKNYRVLIFISKKDKLTHGIIAHEALHATNFILDCIGYQFNPRDDEAICYLHTWVVDEIYKLIKKTNIEIL